jgi:hypothetical protein
MSDGHAGGQGRAGTQRELSFSREGTGTLFYVARLNYAADRLYQDGLDSGFRNPAQLRTVRRKTASRLRRRSPTRRAISCA